MTTYERYLYITKKPYYDFIVSKGRSHRALKVSFSHHGIHPIVLVDDQGDPQLGWRIDFSGSGTYDYDKLPKGLQPLVTDAVNTILDLELAHLTHRVTAWNSVSITDFDRVRDALPQVYTVEAAHAVLARSRALGFENPVSDEALAVAQRTLDDLVDKDTHDQALKDCSEAEDKLSETISEVEELRTSTEENNEPVSDVLEGLEKLKRDLETGWIQYEPGESLKDKVLSRLEEFEWKTISITV
ncbi:hypothetical protein ACTXM3_09405 [Glutamicibacter arilaitensis]|uniref:hypothetical protein n=1 Tax=Glutamicibacter arilaitensis TaxID=256701 RepID=UPI003FD3B2FD